MNLVANIKKYLTKEVLFISISSFIILISLILLTSLYGAMRFFYLASFIIFIIYLASFLCLDYFLKDSNPNFKESKYRLVNKIKAYFVFKKNKIAFIRKALVVILGLFLLARVIGGQDYFRYVNNFDSTFMNSIETGFAVFFNQWYIACIILVIINEFINSELFNKIIKYIVTPLVIISTFIMPYMVEGIIGNIYDLTNNNYDPYGFRVVLLGFEYGILLSYLVYTWFKSFKWDFNKSFLYTFFITIFLILITGINAYTPKTIFPSSLYFLELPLDLNFTHRLLVYISFILPIIYFVILYRYDIKHRRAFLLFISLAVFFCYIAFRRYDNTWSSVSGLPLHLCNTAMYIIPLTLIFKSHQVFYFTMFINVIGAFLALLMPNYSESLGIFSMEVSEFYINHLYAFFMPILIVLLGVYERPKMKYFFYSMAGFLIYFILCVIINAFFDTNFFFLNDDFIVSKLGTWAEDIFDISIIVNTGDKEIIFRPYYLLTFYLVYVILALFMWYIYELLFKVVDSLVLLHEKNIVYNKTYYEFINSQKKEGIDMKKDKNKNNSSIDYNNLVISLDIEHLKKKYGNNKFYTINDFSLHLDGGKIYGFLGKNGAGKSTIIKSIVGMHTFDGGSIKICGYDNKFQEVEAKSLIGFVPDHYALYESLTGREYINYIADLYNVSKKDRDERLNNLLDKLELKDKFDKQIKTYSHGMKQKTTIIAALIHDPKIWILDEPMTGVDPISIFQIKEVMKDHAKKGNIVFFSSHLIDVVKNLCDEVIIIKKGEFIYRDTLVNLKKNKVDLEELFIEKTADSQEEVRELINAESKQ